MPAQRKTTPAEWLDLIAERAQALRDAGVTRLEIGDVVIELGPPDSPAAADSDSTAGLHVSPLEDGATYPNGRVPSLFSPRANRR